MEPQRGASPRNFGWGRTYDAEYVASYYQFSGDVSPSSVNVYDYDRGCFIGGDLPSLYDYGEGSFVEFKANGNRVDGYDYGSGSFYEATVDAREVSIYDYGAGAYFSFST